MAIILRKCLRWYSFALDSKPQLATLNGILYIARAIKI